MPPLFFRTSHSGRPHVTLTFAQSSDGKIAGPDRTQLALSCRESMLMTHKLRTMHDGILVGIGTVLNDDPQLNARLLSLPPSVSDLPRPIVLDSSLRMPTTSKLVHNYASETGRQPLVICKATASMDKQKSLEQAGAEVLRLEDGDSKTALNWATVLSHVHAAGIQRLMVEGGAEIITSLMQEQQLIDTLLVTIAPVHVGVEGLGYSAPLPDHNDPTLWPFRDEQSFGIDTVIVWQKNKNADLQAVEI